MSFIPPNTIISCDDMSVPPPAVGLKRPISKVDSIEERTNKVRRTSIWAEPPAPPPALPLTLGDVSKHLGRSAKRVYTSPFSNTTITRANVNWGQPVAGMAPLAVINSEQNPALDTVEGRDLADRVSDHAYRRIQLFYYQCLAYWKEGVVIDRDQTCLQHGVGPFTGMQAAHSCILPTIKDNFWPHLNGLIEKRGLSTGIGARLLSLGLSSTDLMRLRVAVSTRNPERDPPVNVLDFFPAEDKIKNLDGQRYICRDSYFFQVMNSTVIMPTEVNSFDICIEKVMRPAAVDIINDVSMGKLTPYEATARFVKESQSFFGLALAESDAKIETLDRIYLLEQTLANMEVEVRGVNLDNEKESLRVLERYVRTAHALHRAVNKINLVGSTVSIKRHITKRHKLIQKPMNEVMHYIRCTRAELDKQFSEVLPRRPKSVHQRLIALQGHINKRPWCPYPLGWIRGKLLEMREVVRIQSESSVLPEYELLSGILEEGERRPMTDLELFTQKMQIIRRASEVIEYIDDDFGKESLYPPRK